MTPERLFLALRARWQTVVGVLGLVLLAALLVTWMQPRLYTASAVVLLDVQSPDALVGGALVQPTQASAYVAAQVEIIQSERVIRQVIAAQRLDQRLPGGSRERWQRLTGGEGDYTAWLAELVRKRLDVRPGKESGVITIAYAGSERRQAADIANAFAQAYMDTALQLRVEPARRHRGLFDEQAHGLRVRLEQAQARLLAFQREHGLVAIGQDERLDIETARLNELSTQVVQLQAQVEESGSRQSQALAHIERAPDVMNHPGVAGLNAELSRQEARLSELGTRLGEGHPSMLELKANVRQLRAQLAIETRRVAAGLGINDAVNQTRIAKARGQLEAQRARVLQLKELRDTAVVLQRDVQNAQVAYDSMVTRSAQAALESQRNAASISLLKAASPPALSSSPRLGLNLSVAAILGLVLAVAVAVLREQRDRRLRCAADVPELLDLPLLVEIPSAPRLQAHARPAWMAGLRFTRARS